VSLFNELKRRNVFRVGIAYGVTAWLLIQISDTVLPRIGLPESAVTLVIVLLLIGFVPALIFAWAFEMTPEGLKRERDVDRSQSITRQTGRKLDRVIIGIMAVVIAFLLLDRFVLQENEETGSGTFSIAAEYVPEPSTDPVANAPADASVAVLPFVNMSGDANNEYFSDGLTETLLHMLAQLPELRVAARTSSFAFKGQNRSIGEIAATLKVANILEGSVQRAGDRVRVTAQLIRADDGYHVWSQSYDRTLDDIFVIQDEIANDVARALGTSLLGANDQPMHGVTTQDTQAYEHLLLRQPGGSRRSFQECPRARPRLRRGQVGIGAQFRHETAYGADRVSGGRRRCPASARTGQGSKSGRTPGAGAGTGLRHEHSERRAWIR
jgi:TolB-like protein